MSVINSTNMALQSFSSNKDLDIIITLPLEKRPTQINEEFEQVLQQYFSDRTEFTKIENSADL